MSLVFPPGAANYLWKNVCSQVQERIRTGEPSPALLHPVSQSPSEREITAQAIDCLKKAGVDFGDLRLGYELFRRVGCSDVNLSNHSITSTSGLGVRALVKGYWGFSATSDLSAQGVQTCVNRAVRLATAAAATFPADRALQMKNWAAEEPHQAVFHTPVGLCPFSLESERLAAPLLEAAERGLQVAGIKRATGGLTAMGFRRIVASTEGTDILITHSLIDAFSMFAAVDNGTSASRTHNMTTKGGGFEHVLEENFPDRAATVANEALLKCRACKPTSGEYSLILDGQNLGLTIHESVGHPTELDRILGFELSMAGGSFVRTDMLGNFRYGSPLVNLTADNTIVYGAASRGFDDEGVSCQRFPIVQEGILVGCGTSRETAHAIGQKRANGNCRATTCHDVPIVRIPNLYLEPGREKCSLTDLIADTKDGIYMQGRDSFSIDQMRYNFQFGSDMAWRIRNGRLDEPLRDVIYQAITPEFWASCDGMCDESEWTFGGVMNCGKGHPGQTSQMLHGASPTRFRNIRVGF